MTIQILGPEKTWCVEDGPGVGFLQSRDGLDGPSGVPWGLYPHPWDPGPPVSGTGSQVESVSTTDPLTPLSITLVDLPKMGVGSRRRRRVYTGSRSLGSPGVTGVRGSRGRPGEERRDR